MRECGIAVFDDLRQGVERLEALSDPTAGEVRFGTTEPLATGFVSAALTQMALRYPKMDFHVVQADLNTLRTRDLRACNIEFAVMRILKPFSEDEFALEVLFNEPFVVVVARNSKWARRRNVGLSDLVKERWILPPLPVLLTTIHGAFEAAGLEPPKADVLTLSIHVHHNLLARANSSRPCPASRSVGAMITHPSRCCRSRCRRRTRQLP